MTDSTRLRSLDLNTYSTRLRLASTFCLLAPYLRHPEPSPPTWLLPLLRLAYTLPFALLLHYALRPISTSDKGRVVDSKERRMVILNKSQIECSSNRISTEQNAAQLNRAAFDSIPFDPFPWMWNRMGSNPLKFRFLLDQCLIKCH
jgi:hypothetical protein